MIGKMPSKGFLNGLMALALLVFYWIAFFPGYLTPDSVVMLAYAQGLTPQTNWHPAFGVAIFRELYQHFGSIEAIWLVQTGLFVAAAFWLAGTYRSRWISWLAAPALLLFPPITTNIPALWKDVWALLFVLFCFISFKNFQRERSLLQAAFCVLFAVMAASVRIDYAAIVMGFVLALALEGNRRPWLLVKRLALVMAIFAVGLGGLQSLSDKDVQLRLNPWLTIAMWDIAGVASQGGQAQLPAYMQGWREQQHRDLTSLLQQGYRCETSDFLVFTQGAPPFNLPGRPQQLDPATESSQLKAAWLASITANPRAYFAHRWCVARQFLGFPGYRIHAAFPFGISKNPFGMTYQRSALNERIYGFYKAHAHSWMFRYWIQLALAGLMAVIIALLTRKPLLASVLLLSMLASAARLMVLPAADFRYGLWISAGFVLMTLELLQALAKKSTRAAPHSTLHLTQES